MSHRGRSGCKIVGVGRDACYVRFARTAVKVRSLDSSFPTARGEMMIFDFDSEGRVIGIELIGSGKPCQQDDPGSAPTPGNATTKEDETT